MLGGGTLAKGIIIIPAYNEEENIGSVLEEIFSLNLDLDVVVVNDGSVDKTKEIVEGKNIKVISHPFNLGYGAALQTGFKYAVKNQYEYIIQFDADGQHYGKYIEDMKKEIEKDEYDIILGSRFVGNKEYKIEFQKAIVIRFMRKIIKIFTGIKVTDPTCGFKGYKRKVFSHYALFSNFPSDYPDADIIINMLRRKYRVKEIPITVRERTHGKSMHSGLKPLIYLMKINVSIVIVLLRDIFKGES